MPRVHVLYFAVLRERKARSEEWIEIAPQTAAGELFARLFPDEAGAAIAICVNRARTTAAHRLSDGDEVAFLPPLGGG